MISIISEYLKEKRCTVKENESLKDYCTFKIGGTAELLVMPEDAGCLTGLIKIIKEQNIKYYILGNGSNVLISEKYFNGVFIILSRLNNIEARGDYIYADCGASLNRLAGKARDNNLSGLEFAYGIPGTLGGAVYMNAGAYGGQMSDVVYSSKYMDLDKLEVKTISARAHKFDYRKSIFDENNFLILSSVLELNEGNKAEIEAAMQKNMSARKDKQPIEYASAGSMFKRSEGHYTGKLISDAGLRGYSIGGAQVSEKHCGFIINTGSASAADIKKLISHVKMVVYEKYKVELKEEVRIL